MENKPQKSKEQLDLEAEIVYNEEWKFYISSECDFLKFASNVYERLPFFFDTVHRYWIWDSEKQKWIEIDFVGLFTMAQQWIANPQLSVKASYKKQIQNAFEIVGRQRQPKEPPAEWIQFKDCIFDIKKRDVVGEASAEYFFTNPLPWNLGNPDSTPTIDKLLIEWTGSDYYDTLIEWIAYCCYRKYPLHLIFCAYGSGRNGKSEFNRLVQKFLGTDNCVSEELEDLMHSRFGTYTLYKKLACFVSETNSGTITKTTMLKKMSTDDPVHFEAKGKGRFTDNNYAKLMIASNSMPESKDTTDGFFRRWLIVPFPNQFPTGKPIIENIPDGEFENLAAKVVRILPILLTRGTFTTEGTIKDQEIMYKSISNPIEIFIDENYAHDENGFVRYSELFNTYNQYLKGKKMQTISRYAFTHALDEIGLESTFATKYVNGERMTAQWIIGIYLKKNP